MPLRQFITMMVHHPPQLIFPLKRFVYTKAHFIMQFPLFLIKPSKMDDKDEGRSEDASLLGDCNFGLALFAVDFVFLG